MATHHLALSLDSLHEALAGINALRRRARDGAAGEVLGAAERIIDALFGAGQRLAVYGSLMPGRENHHLMDPIEGEWTTGYVHGDFLDRGWGASGWPDTPGRRPDGPRIPVHILTSPALPAHWARLDRFEGHDYQRILAPAFAVEGGVVVCNIYELRGGE